MESLDSKEEEKLSEDLFSSYEEIVSEIKQNVESKLKDNIMTEEKTVVNDEQSQINTILGFIDFWKKEGFTEVELPEEYTLSMLKKLFLSAVEQMPFQVKMAGGYTEEIDSFYVSLRSRKTNKRKPKISPEELARIEAEKAEALKTAFSILKEVTGNTYEAEDIDTLVKETFKCNLVQFRSLISQDEFSNVLLQTLSIRNIGKEKRGKRDGLRVKKKWNGEGEPFSTTTPTGDVSMTYELWKKLQKGKSSIKDLNAFVNKEFPKANGKERNISSTIRRMKSKVEDHFTIKIPSNQNEKITVTKV